MKQNRTNRFPAHWGEPPRMQTKDLRTLPGGYGKGSGTLAKWIQTHLDQDAASAPGERPGNPPLCGGVHHAPVDSREEAIAAAVRATVETEVGAKPQWTLSSCQRQVVAGTIWYLNVDLGEDEAMHLKVLEQLPHRGGELVVLGILTEKRLQEPLLPFDNNVNLAVRPSVESPPPLQPMGEADWAQLIGTDGQAAKAAIERAPGIDQCVIVPQGAMVTMDWREDRVRVFVDANGNVAQAPSRG